MMGEEKTIIPKTSEKKVAEPEKLTKESKAKKLKKVTKKSLRTMQKTRQKHPMRTQARIAKYGAKGFGRNIW